MVTAAYLALCAIAVALSTFAPLWVALLAGIAATVLAFRHELWLPRVAQFKG